MNGGIAPFPQVQQLALTNKMRLIGLSKSEYEANKGAKAYLTGQAGRYLGVIKQGAYGDNVEMAHDLYTHAATVGIIARKSMSDDEVYAMTKAFWDVVPTAVKTTPWLKDITMEFAVREGGLKLHPGAQRYYLEKGVSIPAGSKM